MIKGLSSGRYWGAALESNGVSGARGRSTHVHPASVKLFPVLALERIDQRKEHAQENEHDDADIDPLALGRLGNVVEIVHEIGDKALVLDGGEPAGNVLGERLHDVLPTLRRLDQRQA